MINDSVTNRGRYRFWLFLKGESGYCLKGGDLQPITRVIIHKSFQHYTVERGDIITIAAGIVIVVVIAVMVKASGIFPPVNHDTGAVTPFPTNPEPSAITKVPAMEVSDVTGTLPTPSPAIPEPVPYRIFYSSKPLDYPVFRLPEHMETFGASEIPWKDPDTVTFAYLEESRGGLTQEFSVPYGLWGMNISADAWTKPQYARFDMVLCYAKDGAVIDGMEILGPGSAFRSVQVSGTGVYIIVHTQNVDKYRITFITPRTYYASAVLNQR